MSPQACGSARCAEGSRLYAQNSSAQQVMKMQGRLPPQQLDQVFSQVLQQALVASDQKVSGAALLVPQHCAPAVVPVL